MASYDWETVEYGIEGFVACCGGDEGDSPIDCRLNLQRAEKGGRVVWRWREDEGGNSGPPRRTEARARADAEAYAYENDEANAGEDASDMSRRLLAEAAGEPDPEGEWCVYWYSAIAEDEGPRDRFASYDAACAACDLANIRLQEQNPGGGLLCGFEVRRLSGEGEGDAWEGE